MADGQEVASMFVKIGADIEGFNSGIKSITDKISSLGALLGVGLGVDALFNLGKSAVDAASEAEQAEVGFAQAIGVVGVKYDLVYNSANRFFEKLQQLTGFQKDQVESSVTRLVQITGDYSKSLDLATLAANFARGSHKSLEEATNLVGKAYEGNVMMLRRYLPDLAKTATSTEALSELNRKFGTSGAAYMETFAGKVETLNNKWQEVKILVGEKLIPVLEKLMDSLLKNWGLLERVGEGVAKLFTYLPSGGNMAAMALKRVSEQFGVIDKLLPHVAEVWSSSFSKVASDGNKAALAARQSFDAFGQKAKEVALSFSTSFAKDFASSFQVFEAGTFDITKAFEKAVDSMIQKIIESGILNLVSLIFGGGMASDGFGILGNLFGGGEKFGPAFADGGFVSGPTVALVGEGGPEYMVPESKVGDFVSSMGGNTTSHSIQNINVSLPSLVHTADASTVKQAIRSVADLFKRQGLITQ